MYMLFSKLLLAHSAFTKYERSGIRKYHRKQLINFVSALLLFATLIPNFSSAENNGRKLAEALGSYLFFIAINEYMQSSKCGYLYKTKYSLEQATRDALLHFKNKDRDELKSLLEKQKSKLVTDAKSMVDAALGAANKDGVDWRSSCGMLLGTIANDFREIKDEYENAILMYSK